MSKKVLVTGGAGFIGSHLCSKLIENGHFVIALDNFFTGKKSNVSHLLDSPRFKLIEHDITNPIDLEVDQVYHMACPASPVHYQSNPIKTTKTCILGSLNVLEIAMKNNARALNASTSEVYGDPEVHPQTESYWGNVNPIGIRACYDEGKRCAETLFVDHHRQHNVQIINARIFNTYGPNMCHDDGRVVSNFIVQALSGKDITIYGDGNQTRSFCYVDDLVEGLVELMDHQGSHDIGPFNIGNPVEFNMKELAEMVLSLTGSKSQIIFKPLPSDDPTKRKPDITKINKRIGFKPSIELKEGLAKTVEYFEKSLSVS